MHGHGWAPLLEGPRDVGSGQNARLAAHNRGERAAAADSDLLRRIAGKLVGAGDLVGSVT